MTTIAAAESTDPDRAVRRITRSLAFRILLFYLVPITLILAVIPWDSVKPGVSPFATALSAMHIPGAVAIMNVVVLAAVLSYLNSALYATSRVLSVLASKGDAPHWLIYISRRGKAPTRAIIISSLFGYLALCASILSPEFVFSFLINTSGTTMMFIYALVCLAQVRSRGRESYRDAWFYPWSTYAAILGIGTVLAAMAVTAELASQLYSSLLVTVLVSGALVLRRRKLPIAVCEAQLTEARSHPSKIQI
jgi:L-asparagine transporter-like permease